jgi:hypothetical protein
MAEGSKGMTSAVQKPSNLLETHGNSTPGKGRALKGNLSFTYPLIYKLEFSQELHKQLVWYQVCGTSEDLYTKFTMK